MDVTNLDHVAEIGAYFGFGGELFEGWHWNGLVYVGEGH
jgi:hypothetical protein